ncbi:MAG: hypothetical protein SRB1_00160 [Desulfobacteraceae bacterium Eth-SRB1]|nr:MAG: hypothetical protein SRB1_00160 [Desulfobacteraceae bacterium Eth-SRB1]
MDNEQILRQFEEIEEKVVRLIDVCKAHEATNSELRDKIRRLEEELQSKVEIETNYSQERDLIRSKIDSLLARLDDIA